MKNAIQDTETKGLFGEKVTSTSDGNDGKISLVQFDVSELQKNIKNLEKAELELTLINRRDGSISGTDRLMVVPVTEDWDATNVTWNTHPAWNTDSVLYSDEFQIDKNGAVKNNVGITASSYDGTKVTVDVTELVKNMKENNHVLSLAICDEKGYELAFASTEGAAKLDAEKEAAPLLRGIVKRTYGKDAEVSRTAVAQDTFAGSWSGDQSADFGSKNFLRTSYGTDSKGILGTEGGSDNKVTYLKFDISQIDLNQADHVKLQMSLLGLRYDEAKNKDTQIQVAMAENTDWTENSLNWKNKPAILSQYGVVTSEEFNLGSVVSNDPGKISIPNGTVATTDVTEFIAAAKENKQDTVTLAVNVAGTNNVDKANRIFFVSKEGAQAYPDAQNMAPVLIETKTVAVSGLKVNAPTKTVYDLGESLDTTGMTVTASYEDGTEDSVDLSKVVISGFDSSKVSDNQTVTVKYAGQTASFAVTIKDVALEQAKERAVSAVKEKAETVAAEIEKLANLSIEQKDTYKAEAENKAKEAEIAINEASSADVMAEIEASVEAELDQILEAAKDADKKAEPAPEPEPVHKDGLSDEADTDGNWYYYLNNKIATEVTTVANNKNGWWSVVNGKVDFSYTGLAANEYGWFKVTNGKVDFGYTGLAANEYGWFKVTNGKVDFDYTGLAANEYGWFKVTNGKVDFDYTGLAANEYGWFKVTNGKVDFDYTGFATNDYGQWYVQNGKVDFSK